ncbi:class I SAM-dependent methyltransferase [Desulfovibrio ferrophilus]|uniref:Tellurite resistance methyltransferase TehB-like domain-containing protein n=1 Tax=Desulfovibrio ferrophilus TaxID=241368 RepID=A0A2Z6B1F9_9BACT|nr:hypothetical protein [Desulfovibrio ferrophilus]BBD09311.1 uncharacterized protein DFE_2585 [Desulfovibrio ferrophilus]
MKKIDEKNVEWIITGFRHADRLGRVFRYQGDIYRAIFPEAEQYVLQHFESGLIPKLIKNNLLIDTRITDLHMESSPLILRHETIPFVTRPATWSFTALKRAAQLYLDLNRFLLDYGLGTIDGHQENIQFIHNHKPVWIDLGSILPLTSINNGESSLKQFVICFLNVLMVQMEKPNLHNALRHILFKVGSIRNYELKEILGREYDFPYFSRSKCLDIFQNIINEITVDQQETKWAKYHKDADFLNLEFEQSPDTRSHLIHEIIKDLKPKKAIDIACNAGRFSLMMAHEGVQTYGFDIDETAIMRFENHVEQLSPRYHISIGVEGLFGTLTANRYDFRQAINPDIQGDMACAFALTHHLAVTRKLPFPTIVEKISSLTTHRLLVEFMPNGVGKRQPEGYTLHNFIQSFQGYFRNVTILYYPVPEAWSFRVLLLFENRLPEGDLSPLDIATSYFALDRLDSGFTYTKKYDKWGDMVLRIVCPGCEEQLRFDKAKNLICPDCATPLKGDIWKSN